VTDIRPAGVVNHTGLCVSDLDRSQAFYVGAFGFVPWRENDPPDSPTAQLLQLDPPVGLHASYLRLDGYVLELLSYRDHDTKPGHHAMDRVGLTHLSISVADIAAACTRVRELGGSVVESTDLGSAVMVRDPDGQLIELLPMEYAERVRSTAPRT
jgi:catechol 2,3-dioxygenase-like lactoylglutathione lyase family enzyme